MKLLGGTDDSRVPQVQQARPQDDAAAAVGYGFQRHPHPGEVDFPHYADKQSRWASGDDGIIEVCLLNYPPCSFINRAQLIQMRSLDSTLESSASSHIHFTYSYII